MSAEAHLRQLAQQIAALISDTTDVLDNHSVTVPGLHTLNYVPMDHNGLDQNLSAFRLINELLAAGQQSTLATIHDQLDLVREHLLWGHAPGYTAETVGQTFLDNYCHALLTGPDGPLVGDSPLGAFVLFGPNTLYRDHSHAPNEIYLALSGGGEWRVGEHPWTELDAGQTIFIPAHAVHAIRTRDKPLLTFSFWLDQGDMADIAI